MSGGINAVRRLCSSAAALASTDGSCATPDHAAGWLPRLESDWSSFNLLWLCTLLWDSLLPAIADPSAFPPPRLVGHDVRLKLSGGVFAFDL